EAEDANAAEAPRDPPDCSSQIPVHEVTPGVLSELARDALNGLPVRLENRLQMLLLWIELRSALEEWNDLVGMHMFYPLRRLVSRLLCRSEERMEAFESEESFYFDASEMRSAWASEDETHSWKLTEDRDNPRVELVPSAARTVEASPLVWGHVHLI